MFKFIWWAVAVALGTFCTHAASAASITELKGEVEGVYALDEWHIDGKVFRPSQVDGRFVLNNGAVITILLNNAEETNRTSISQFGVFVLDETSFSYRYDTRSNFRQAPSGITPLGAPRFEGMRRFVLSVEGKAVHLNSGQQEFVFTSEGLAYSENGKLLRRWRRIKGD
jgi:hypothetical protein